jgi:hypothetical protein
MATRIPADCEFCSTVGTDEKQGADSSSATVQAPRPGAVDYLKLDSDQENFKSVVGQSTPRRTQSSIAGGGESEADPAKTDRADFKSCAVIELARPSISFYRMKLLRC